MSDLRERVQRLIMLGMGGMLGATQENQEKFLAQTKAMEASAPEGLDGDLRLTVDAVIAEVAMSLGDVLRVSVPPPATVTNMPNPTPAMLAGDPLFDAIWQAIKGWDIGVPGVYSGYCGALGNHARAIYDAVRMQQGALTPTGEQIDAELKRLRAGMEKALEEIEDAGPKALKYAGDELRKALGR
jgi:hypothetical protein